MSEWRKFVKEHYETMKKENPNTKLGDAMKSAAKHWKKNKKGGDGTVSPATVSTNTPTHPNWNVLRSFVACISELYAT